VSTIQKLKDEVGRLQKKLNSTKKPIAERNKFESENTKLKAEVENLTRINNEVINSRDELRRQLDAKEVASA
jgi:predicted  nucleic acid-binding Zn-ribbon protein